MGKKSVTPDIENNICCDIIQVSRPKDYTTTVDRVTKKLFKNELTRPLDDEEEKLWNVSLDGKKRSAVARVAIDYKNLIESNVVSQLPKLTSKHYIVHDAIITLILAGNRKITYAMIYRAMTGKIKGSITVPEDMATFIDECLAVFGSRIQIRFSGTSPDGTKIEVDFDEPLVTYNLGMAKVNGKIVKKVVIIPDDPRFDPPLLKWARANGNEIDTRDITLLDVPGINNGNESLILKMCLYRRIIKMKNVFERVKKSRFELPENQRTIRYDYIYEELGLKNPNANKRRLVKSKIDRCLEYWKERGLISDYKHKKDRGADNTYYAVLVSFMPHSNRVP